MIPFYAALAGSGKILSFDDPAVVKDDAALNGSGGTAYAPFLVSAPASLKGGWGTLRRLDQRVAHDGAVTFKARAQRDGNDTGQEITRVIALSDQSQVEAPFFATGSEFAVRLELSAFTAPAALGPATLWVVPRRSTR